MKRRSISPAVIACPYVGFHHQKSNAFMGGMRPNWLWLDEKCKWMCAVCDPLQPHATQINDIRVLKTFRITLFILAAMRICGRNAGKMNWRNSFDRMIWRLWVDFSPGGPETSRILTYFWDLGGTVRGSCNIFEGRAAATSADLWYVAGCCV